MQTNKPERKKEKDSLLSELEQELEQEMVYQRYSQLIQEGIFDDKDKEERIESLKEKKLYKVLIKKLSDKRKEESSKMIYSIILKTVTISGFHFAIVAFILTSSMEITMNPSALYLYFGSIIILFFVNIILLPILFLSAHGESSYSELVANVNIIQSMICLCFILGDVMINTFGLNIKHIWAFVGGPGLVLIMLVILIIYLRKLDTEDLDSNS